MPTGCDGSNGCCYVGGAVAADTQSSAAASAKVAAAAAAASTILVVVVVVAAVAASVEATPTQPAKLKVSLDLLGYVAAMKMQQPLLAQKSARSWRSSTRRIGRMSASIKSTVAFGYPVTLPFASRTAAQYL